MTLVPPASGEVEVSVVMVTFGAWQSTERAVAALIEHTPRRFELIVVDNASDDGTRDRLGELSSAHVILNDRNVGFGPAANQGADQAHGPYLLFLNTDAFVHPGWLEPLLETVECAGVGAVVPRFLHPNGTLQDAGALLAQDGTVMVYGDGDDPDRLCYRFRRVVDIGSAACMLVKRSLFLAVGGFDELFTPAYYEDADLCMRLAHEGLQVVYEPRSTVTHMRYGSGGSDSAATLSARNRALFVTRWRDHLVGRPWTFNRGSEQAVLAARDAPADPRVAICAAAGRSGARELAGMLIDLWPRARVTWAVATTMSAELDLDQLLMLGIEILMEDESSWLSGRLFHYDLVVSDASVGPLLANALADTQPQAVSLSLSMLAGSSEAMRVHLAPVMNWAGIAPPRTAAGLSR